MTTATAPAAERLRPTRGAFGTWDLVQVVVVESVALTIANAVGAGPVTNLIAATAAVLLVAVFGRRAGRTWLERALISRQYRRRRRDQAAARAGEDPRLTALRSLAGELAIDEVKAGDGTRVGVGCDSAGWFALADVTPIEPQGASRSVPLDLLVRALNEVDQPGAAVQVVLHADDAGQRRGHARRVTWVAVRLDARGLAEAGADDITNAPAVVVALIRRVARTLSRSGFAAQVADRQGLLAALARSCGVERIGGATGFDQAVTVPREDWRAWNWGELRHRAFWVSRWPPIAEAGELLTLFSSVPAAIFSVSFVLAADGDVTSVRCLVRVAAPFASLERLSDALAESALDANAELFQLDGEQAAAVYACAPTGGGPR